MQIKLLISAILFGFLISLCEIHFAESRKSGGSSSKSSSSSSSGSWWGSSSRSSSKSSSSYGGGSWKSSSGSNYGKNKGTGSRIWKTKTTGRSKSFAGGSSKSSYQTSYHPSASSYPKQEWKVKVSKGIGGGGFQHVGKSGKLKSIGRVSSGIGGGGWVTPKTNQKSNHFTFDNTFGRYGGGKEVSGKSRSWRLFGESGKHSFGIQRGAGFAGRANAGLASMEAFHRYKQYKAMVKYKRYGRYHDYSGHGLYYYHNRYHHCYGGCYGGGSFCDYGICRCYHGYFASYGSCWNNWDSQNEQKDELRRSSGFNPFVSCSNNNTCQIIDMNLICPTESQKCECREDMKWNEDALECQVFMDVDCSIFQNSTKFQKLMSNDANSTSDSPPLSDEMESMREDLNPKWDDCVDDEEGAINAGLPMTKHFIGIDGNKLPIIKYKPNGSECHMPEHPWNINFTAKMDFPEYLDCNHHQYQKYCPKTCQKCYEKFLAEYGGFDVEGISLPSYNLTKDNNGTFSFNLTEISPKETLSTSYLPKLDLKKTEPLQIKKEFCLEINALSLKYSEPERTEELRKEVRPEY